MINLSKNNITRTIIPMAPLPKENKFKLLETVAYYLNNVVGNVIIPMGFICDGASIPRIAWLTTGTPFEPDHLLAGLVHDYFYQFGRNYGVTREVADLEYKILLGKCGKSRYTCWKEHKALRIWGKKNYR